MEQPCGSYCLLKKKVVFACNDCQLSVFTYQLVYTKYLFWSLESYNKYPDKPWSEWKGSAESLTNCIAFNQLETGNCVYFTWLEFPLMKCPSDCSGGYMVPKVMCSICIEEYSGYNGGYGRYSIISCNACFKSKSVLLQYSGFINSYYCTRFNHITIVNFGVNPFPPGCLAEELHCFALIMDYEMM